MANPAELVLEVFGHACCVPGTTHSALLPYLAGVILWATFCLYEAFSPQKQGDRMTQSLLLPASLLFCLLLEIILLWINTHTLDLVEQGLTFNRGWLLTETLLLGLSRALMAAAFIGLLSRDSRRQNRYLLSATLVLMVFTLPALWQFDSQPVAVSQAAADSPGTVWIKLAMIIVLGMALVSLCRGRETNDKPVIWAMLLFLADSILTLILSNLTYLHDQPVALVHGNLSNLAIFFLGYASMRIRQTNERRLQTGIQTSERLEALGQLSSGIAHDFNNHLQIILGYVELARAQTDNEKARSASLKHIEEAAGAAGDLVNQLLMFSRGQATDFVVLNLNDVILSTSPMLSRLLGPDTHLKHDLDLNIATISADRRMIEQILLNLVINSRDAMPGGGTIVIRTQASLPDIPTDRTSARELQTRLTVADTGCGMDRETQRRALDPFYTTKPVGEGTGLGLTTVYGITSKHAAHLSIDTRPGQFTQVHIDFPACRQPSSDQTPIPHPAANGSGEVILLVEDEAALRDLIHDFLTAADYKVLIANDGQHAINIASTYPGKIDLCLFDVIMPRLSGYEAYDRIRSRNRDIPALFVTGSTSRAEVLRTQHHHLQKPFTADTLLRAVRRALEQTSHV